ncbi:hypothetical protein GCM10010211_37400 [Streptomyces albospinus]|uniref:Uncharacterized protein n=1 Tax=Streptomyces albospinus TaxID=285515 RepID=A0ABQ2V663_9ACTN|nr:hypothetical protein GCM10010211_37400 [Streptomyces albospinus]
MDEISVRGLLLLLVGALAGYAAFRHPELGAAIGVAVIVVALLHDLLAK